ncbi:DUF418 domain-containing protein [Paenibacillaceae bacterium]|nr:DUF418 domain-containing protein [Paenibacillaceae bacterium]
MTVLKTEQTRMDIIDVIRGLALLGVFIVNMRFFNASYLAIVMQMELWNSMWNQLVNKLVELFVIGKFISIFSFLFGFGMVIMMERTVAKGKRFAPLYLRRMLALLLFGLLHGLMIWYGDILFHYALLGCLLLLFSKRKPATLLIWSLALLSLLPLFTLIIGTSGMGEMSPEQTQYLSQAIEAETQIYSQGSFAAILELRISHWISGVFNQLLFYPHLLGMFLLGGYFAKKKILHPASGNEKLIRRLCGWTLPAYCLLLLTVHLGDERWSNMAMLPSWLVGAVFYITLLAVLFQKPGWHRLLMPFSYVGRMAFTNYLMQSVVCSLIFYGYGLGFFGKADYVAGLLITIVIFGLQVVCSKLWLSHFRMGPLEWVWRRFTYWGKGADGGQQNEQQVTM